MTLDFKYTPLDDRLCSYIQTNRTHDEADAVLAELRDETRRFGRLAVMQIPEDQGAFLRLLVKMTRARNVIEVGTFTGYSSICLALGIATGGKLTTCETNSKFSDVARRYCRNLGLADKVRFVHHEALSFIKAQPRKRIYDFAFVDADRKHCADYFEELVVRVRTDGLIVFDNALAKGQIAEGATASVKARNCLNALAARDSRVEALIVPIGDGMLMCRVKI